MAVPTVTHLVNGSGFGGNRAGIYQVNFDPAAAANAGFLKDMKPGSLIIRVGSLSAGCAEVCTTGLYMVVCHACDVTPTLVEFGSAVATPREIEEDDETRSVSKTANVNPNANLWKQARRRGPASRVWLDLVVGGLAAAYIQYVVVEAVLLDTLRPRLARFPVIGKVMSCSNCAAFWCGCFVYLLWLGGPYTFWFAWVCAWATCVQVLALLRWKMGG